MVDALSSQEEELNEIHEIKKVATRKEGVSSLSSFQAIILHTTKFSQ
jgi:hypothetical protein